MSNGCSMNWLPSRRISARAATTDRRHTMTTKYTFIEDPGHGWLVVNREEIFSLGIELKVSSYSYQEGGLVYLEEDCDAPLFIKAKEQRGQPVQLDIEVYERGLHPV